MRLQSPPATSYSQKNLHESTSPPHLPHIQTTGLTSPLTHGDKKVIDCRTRPGTPHKDKIKTSNIIESTKNLIHATSLK
jgi:hypothetical protein